MALKIALKPHERMIIGGAVVKNGAKGTELFVENTVPILREKDILSEREATTPCRRLYFVIQLMYIDGANLPKYHTTYWELARDVVAAAPSTVKILDQVNEGILAGKFYHALKLSRQLIEYEEELLKHACEPH